MTRNRLVIFLVCVLFLLIGFGAVVVFEIFGNENRLGKTSNWLTFKDEGSAIEYSYPSVFAKNDLCDPQKSPGENPGDLSIRMETGGNASLDDHIKVEVENRDWVTKDLQYFKVSGHDAVDFIKLYNGKDYLYSAIVYYGKVNDGNLFYYFDGSLPNVQGIPATCGEDKFGLPVRQVYRDIVASIKFDDRKLMAQSSLAGIYKSNFYLTYTNQKYGYEIAYSIFTRDITESENSIDFLTAQDSMGIQVLPMPEKGLQSYVCNQYVSVWKDEAKDCNGFFLKGDFSGNSPSSGFQVKKVEVGEDNTPGFEITQGGGFNGVGSSIYFIFKDKLFIIHGSGDGPIDDSIIKTFRSTKS